MLAVAVQLPAAVLTNDCCGVTGLAPSPSELELEPEASAGAAASMSNAQVADPTNLTRTTKPPFPLAWMNQARIGRKPCARLTRP
jgi:hypothetical protein